MKRLIALFLVALMLVLALAACNNAETKPTDATEKPTSGADATADLEAAKEYLKNMYKEDTAKSTPRSFDVAGKIVIGTLTYTVEWKSSIEAVTVAPSKVAGFFTIVVPDKNETETPYTLTATIKYGDQSVELVIDCILPLIDNAGIVSDLQADVAYKMFLYQANTSQNLYATHAMDQDKFFKTTNDAKQAPDFFAEVVDGGYKFYTMIDGAKKYVEAWLEMSDPTKPSKRLRFVDSTENVWTYEAETNAWFVTLNEAKYVLGTYSSYTTFCISDATYITAENTGVSQFPASFMIKEVAESLTPDEEQSKPIPQMENPLKPEEGTVYRFGFVHGGKDNKVYYVNGKMSTYYLATTEEIASGANFYVEATDGGYYLYTAANKEAAKTYLNVVLNGTHINAVYADAPASVYVWDEELKTLKTTLDGTEYIIGTSATGTYTTLQPAKTTGNFYAQFVAAPEGAEDAPVVTEAELKTIAELNEIGAKLEDKGDPTAVSYRVFGVITEIKQNTYGNCYITDATGATLYVYGLYDADGNKYGDLANKPVAGDYVELEGVISNYNGAQMKNAVIKSHTAPSSIKDLNDKASALEDKGDTSTESYLVVGVVSEVKHNTYGNMYVQDAEGNSLYVYGVYNAAGDKYGDFTTAKPVAGDTVVLFGVLANYNGPQMKNATLVAHTPAAGEEGGEEGGEAVEGGEKFAIAANAGTLADDTLSISWASDNFTILAEKDDSTTNIRTSDEDHFRLYQNSKMTISATNGKKITKIVLECTGGKNFAAESIVTEGVSAVINDNIATLTVDSGSLETIVFDAVAQTRIKTITVVFE